MQLTASKPAVSRHKADGDIYGIPCGIRNRATRSAIQHVLVSIRRRKAADFVDLQRFVRRILPLSVGQQLDGTLGEWKVEGWAAPDDPTTWSYGIDRTPGSLLLRDSFRSRDEAIGVIAHEFGHACTTMTDRERRGLHLGDEWSSELAADWYACLKWGFGREIKLLRRSRDLGHHGPWPGSTFDYDGRAYRVTRNFCIRAR
jgi:hypothetical protein